MVGWPRHFQSLLRQAGKRFENRNTAPINLCYHTKASPVLGEGPYSRTLWSPHFPCPSRPFYQYLQQLAFTCSRKLLADFSDATPVSSPLLIDSGKTETEKAVSKPSKVQAVLKGIKQVIHSARANAIHNHGFDGDRLLVAEAFVGKGFYQKRVSYHAKGRAGIKVRPECRLTVVVREITPDEDAEIAKLKVANFRKLSKREKRLVPHKLIESTPIWSRKGTSKDRVTGAMGA